MSLLYTNSNLESAYIHICLTCLKPVVLLEVSCWSLLGSKGLIYLIKMKHWKCGLWLGKSCVSITVWKNMERFMPSHAPSHFRRHKHRCIFIFKCINGLIDFDFKLTTNNNIHSHNTRTSKNLHLPKVNTNWGKQKPTYQASNDFNNLDNTIKNTDSLPKFKTFLNCMDTRKMFSIS